MLNFDSLVQSATVPGPSVTDWLAFRIAQSRPCCHVSATFYLSAQRTLIVLLTLSALSRVVFVTPPTNQNSHITKDTFRPHTSHGRLGSPSRSSSLELFEPQHTSIHRYMNHAIYSVCTVPAM